MAGSQKIRKITWTEFLKWGLVLNGGLLITAAGVHFFKTPNKFAMGGTSGISIILSSLFPALNVGSAMFLVNGLLVVLGLIFLGRKAMGVTIYSSFAVSAFISLFEWLFPIQAPFTDDTLLELLFAVILPAVGSAMVFNVGASTGGTDILAMILSKFSSMEIGKALLVSDFLIALIAGGLFGVKTGMYCVLGLAMKAFLVDSVIESMNLRKVVTVVSAKSDEVKRFIVEELHRSATVYTAKGAYTGQAEEVLTTVLTRRQTVALRNHIRRVDPKAFLTIVNSSEIVGKGFRDL